MSEENVIRSILANGFQYRIRIEEVKERSWFGLGPMKTSFIWVLERNHTDFWEDVSISTKFKTRQEAVKSGHDALSGIHQEQYLTYDDFTGLPAKLAHWECMVKERDGNTVWCHAHALDGSGDIEFWELDVVGNLWEEGHVFYVVGPKTEKVETDSPEDIVLAKRTDFLDRLKALCKEFDVEVTADWDFLEWITRECLPHFEGSVGEEGFGFIVTMDELR